jgi:hypothetical protein
LGTPTLEGSSSESVDWNNTLSESGLCSIEWVPPESGGDCKNLYLHLYFSIGVFQHHHKTQGRVNLLLVVPAIGSCQKSTLVVLAVPPDQHGWGSSRRRCAFFVYPCHNLFFYFFALTRPYK